MKIIKILLIVNLVLNTLNVAAQNTLWLTNGKKITIGDFKIDNKDFLSYKTSKNKIKSIESFDVFSIIQNNGQEIILYQPDSIIEGSFSLIEMRAFVQGQTDAKDNFKSPLITAGGIVLISASAVAINPVVVILVAGSYCTVIGVTKTSNKKIIIPSDYQNNEHYILGYKKECKQKRIKNAILGSGIGLAIGFTAFAILANNAK
jgi:hypothetical protein